MSFEAYLTIERLMRLADEYAREARQARADARTAYRRGAEAMREACARVADSAKARRADEYTAEEIADAIRALPIPEKP